MCPPFVATSLVQSNTIESRTRSPVGHVFRRIHACSPPKRVQTRVCYDAPQHPFQPPALGQTQFSPACVALLPTYSAVCIPSPHQTVCRREFVRMHHAITSILLPSPSTILAYQNTPLSRLRRRTLFVLASSLKAVVLELVDCVRSFSSCANTMDARSTRCSNAWLNRWRKATSSFMFLKR